MNPNPLTNEKRCYFLDAQPFFREKDVLSAIELLRRKIGWFGFTVYEHKRLNQMIDEIFPIAKRKE